MMTPQADRNASAFHSLAAVIEQSLQPQNQQIRPAQKSNPERDYRKMLDALDQHQSAREIQAAYSLY